MNSAVKIIEQPSAKDRQAILGGLVEFNRTHAPPAEAEALCVGIVGDDGELTGGLYGTTS